MHMVNVTARAVERLRGFFKDDPTARGKSLRLKVVPSGCAGFKYDVSFDNRQEGDSAFPQPGFEILVDTKSLPYFEEATVDYGDDGMSAGFKITNPKEKGSCGCGQSKTF